MTTGIFVGRFQPLHNGHVDAVRQLMKEVDSIVLVVADVGKFNDRNPFSVEATEEMIKAMFPSLRVEVVKDVSSDDEWFAEISRLVPRIDLAMTGNDWTREALESHGVEVREQDFNIELCATEVREKIRARVEWKHLVPPEVVPVIEKNIDKVLM